MIRPEIRCPGERATAPEAWPIPARGPNVAQGTCSIDGCGRTSARLKRGWCDTHYRRYLKTGDPRTGGPIGPRSNIRRPCSVDGCDQPSQAKALCDLHYRRWRKTGNPGPLLRRTPYTPEELAVRTRELAKSSYQRNREKNCARAKRYRDEHPGYSDAKGREWRAANPGYQSAHAKAWYAANPERAREIWADTSGRRRQRVESTSAERINWVRLRAKYGKVCHLCHLPIGEGQMSWDHVVPLARGGTHTEDNLKPAHRRCNSRKGAREGLPDDGPSRPEFPVAS